MAVEVFANQPSTTVTSGGTTAPASGTTESWTVASSSSFPVISSGVTQFHVADVATGLQSEIVAVTSISGTTWTVTRGAENTVPVAHAGGFSITQVVTAGGLGDFPPVFNVMTYGATGNGTTDDTTAIQAAMNAAGPTGGTVSFPPGNYLVSSPLRWDTRASSVVTLAPSLTGAAGMSGPSAGSGATAGVVQLTAASGFPVGEYMIDYLGPAPAGGSAGNTGFTNSGFILQCNSKAAGVRSLNGENSTWKNLVINNGAVPNSTYFNSGNDLGAVNFVASPSSEAYQNLAERIFVYGSGKHAFNLQEGTGSFVYVNNCVSINAQQCGYNVGGATTLNNCVEQGSAVAGWQLKGILINLNGCVSQPSGTSKNIFFVVHGTGQININGGTFTGTSKTGLSASNGSLLFFDGAGTTFVSMTGVSLRPGGTSGYPLLYVSGSTGTGTWAMTGCDISQGAAYFSSVFSNPLITNNSAGLTIACTNCPGINPAGVQTVTVPATTVATTALTFPATFYVTTTAAVSVAISGGPTIVLPTTGVTPVRVPAGQTLTPTYASTAPTWVVEGE